ncbi:MAG TPA: acyl-ACP--UDP-N-acetylglucosamine O-acyltransferase [Terriglobales bacterium]|nr:acyl-ACP--UDP-N-acetylglucosamine O-acyltransferase [Terriglobales bacterium]
MAETRVDSTARIAAGAELDTEVVVEPYAIIGAEVRIGSGTVVGAHAVLSGRTTIGRDNRIFHHASVGAAPQDLKFHGEDSELVLGDHNTVREFATLHLGTENGGMITRLGSHNLIMAYAHVAHDCRLGDYNILANGAQLGGHVSVADHVRLGALVGVHQFVRIGSGAIVGAGSMVSQDVPPYCNATGDRAHLFGLNLEGLRRLGVGSERISELKRAYRLLFRSGMTVVAAAARIRAELPATAAVEELVNFVEASQRGVCRERGRGEIEPDES